MEQGKWIGRLVAQAFGRGETGARNPYVVWTFQIASGRFEGQTVKRLQSLSEKSAGQYRRSYAAMGWDGSFSYYSPAAVRSLQTLVELTVTEEEYTDPKSGKPRKKLAVAWVDRPGGRVSNELSPQELKALDDRDRFLDVPDVTPPHDEDGVIDEDGFAASPAEAS